MEKNGNVALFFLGLIGYFVLRYWIGLSLSVMVAAALGIGIAVAIGWPLGALTGHILSRDSDVDGRAFQLVAWANLVAWIIPIVGMTVSYMTTRFSKQSDYYQLRYWLLASIGGLFAVANAGWGSASAQIAKEQITLVEQSDGVRSGGVRSTERCEFAAIERWSNEDFERYCR
jgi:hypothetical protein